ncbi:MAG TPA: hypothetical protein VH573_16370 [Mycobacteriales bacterium]
MLALVTGVPVALLLLAGCGGGSSTSDSAAAAPAPSATASPGSAGGSGAPGRGRGPAASGEIAAVTGKTLQVQNSQSQTAVTWSASTAFTKTVPATLAVGDCVTATGTAGSGSALTATSVRVLSTGGTCTPNRNGGPAGGPDRTPRPRPSGGFSPPAGRAGGGQDFATAFGTVSAVSASTVTVTGRLLTGGRFRGSGTPAATPTSGPVTVTLGSSASVLRTVKATGADAKVGTCAVATGKADSSGAVAATAIALSAKAANGCTGGFGGRFGGFGGFGG